MTETQQQRELIKRFREQYPEFELCTRQSLNGLNFGGGQKAARMINQIKSTGSVLGESDLFFAIPAGEFHGLFIELKADKSTKIQKGQLEYLEKMDSLGYAAVMCVGLESAWQTIVDYMRGHNG